MKICFLENKKRKEKILLSLDIGTEAIKAVIFQEKNGKVRILADSLQYFEEYGTFNGKNFEIDIIRKTILKVINELRQNLSFSLISKDLKNKIEQQKKWKVFLGISPDKLKGRIIFQEFLRKNPHQQTSEEEAKIIYQEIIKKAQQDISKRFAKKFGILPIDIYFNSIKILEVKIDGYNVLNLPGYKGKNLRFKILITFLPKHFLENIKKIFEKQSFESSVSYPIELEILKIVHPAENLSILYDYNNEKKNGIFIDVGGNITQFFLVEDGNLQQINEFEIGGKNFSEILSQHFGINAKTARILKERYSDKFLSIGAVQKIKKIFNSEQKNWYLNFREKIEKIKQRELFVSDIYLFGGGSLLPEIKEILEEEISFKKLLISGVPKIKFIYPQNFKNIENIDGGLKTIQSVPSLLICQYVKEIF